MSFLFGRRRQPAELVKFIKDLTVKLHEAPPNVDRVSLLFVYRAR